VLSPSGTGILILFSSTSTSPLAPAWRVAGHFTLISSSYDATLMQTPVSVEIKLKKKFQVHQNPALKELDWIYRYIQCLLHDDIPTYTVWSVRPAKQIEPL
jgi:hypothetical protein